MGKALGDDGLLAKYYIFSQHLLEHLTAVCNAIMEMSKVPNSWNLSNLIVIPKPHKDLQALALYRPIALLNQDAKIFTAVLTSHVTMHGGLYSF